MGAYDNVDQAIDEIELFLDVHCAEDKRTVRGEGGRQEDFKGVDVGDVERFDNRGVAGGDRANWTSRVLL